MVREENVKDDLRRPDEESSLQKKINELFIKAEKNKNKNNRQIICELNSNRARLEEKKGTQNFAAPSLGAA